MKIDNENRLKIIDSLIEISKLPGEYFIQDDVIKSAKISRDSGIGVFKELLREGCLTIYEEGYFKKYNFTTENYNSKEFKTYFYNALQLGGLKGALLKNIRKTPGITTKQLAKLTKNSINTSLLNLRKLKKDNLIFFKKRNYTDVVFIYYWYPTKDYTTLLEELK